MALNWLAKIKIEIMLKIFLKNHRSHNQSTMHYHISEL